MATEMQDTPSDEKLANIYLLLGVALMVLGAVAIFFSFFFTIGTVVIIGAILLAAGIVEFVQAFQTRSRRRIIFNILSGLAYLVAGVLILMNPLLGAVTLTLLMSVFFFVAGIIRTAYALSHRKERQWAIFLLGGIVNIVLGAVIAASWPAISLWIIGLFVGVEMLFHGGAWIALSSIVHTHKPPTAQPSL